MSKKLFIIAVCVLVATNSFCAGERRRTLRPVRTTPVAPLRPRTYLPRLPLEKCEEMDRLKKAELAAIATETTKAQEKAALRDRYRPSNVDPTWAATPTPRTDKTSTAWSDNQ